MQHQHEVLDQFVTHHEAIFLSQNLIKQSIDENGKSFLSVDELESLSEMSLETLRLLNRSESIQALRSDSFTLANIAGKEAAFIEMLLWPQCLEALLLERTTIDLLKELSVVELHAANVKDDYPTCSFSCGV